MLQSAVNKVRHPLYYRQTSQVIDPVLACITSLLNLLDNEKDDSLPAIVQKYSEEAQAKIVSGYTEAMVAISGLEHTSLTNLTAHGITSQHSTDEAKRMLGTAMQDGARWAAKGWDTFFSDRIASLFNKCVHDMAHLQLAKEKHNGELLEEALLDIGNTIADFGVTVYTVDQLYFKWLISEKYLALWRVSFLPRYQANIVQLNSLRDWMPHNTRRILQRLVGQLGQLSWLPKEGVTDAF